MKKSLFFISFMLLIGFSSLLSSENISSYGNSNSFNNQKSFGNLKLNSLSADTIKIVGNDNLALFASSGNGTTDYPYIETSIHIF